METALPILLFLTGLFLFVMFALAMGMLSREQERKEAEENATKAALKRVAGPRFFANLEPGEGSDSRRLDRLSMVAALERYLGAERLGARRFVAEPSASSLFCNGDRGVGVVVGRLERYLEEERRAARGFGFDAEPPWFDVTSRVSGATPVTAVAGGTNGRRT